MPYLPSKPPPTSSDDGTALAFYLEDELSRLAMSLLDDVQAVEVRPAHALPLRPRAGMVVYADGTDWNPGSGEGPYVYGSDAAWHGLLTAPSLPGTTFPLRGYISGLTLSAAGATATFGIAVGVATNSTNVAMLSLASAYTKTTSSWALGSAVGALDTGAIANSTWYHVFLIKRVDTGVVDVLISLSSSAPTLPTNYTLFRRIGSMKTNGSAQWVKFLQLGDDFIWDVPVQDANASALGTTSTLYSLTVPSGFSVEAAFHGFWTSNTANSFITIQSPLITTQVANTPNGNISLTNDVVALGSSGLFRFQTDTSGRVRAVAGAVYAGAAFYIVTLGWRDTRGRYD